MKKVIILLLLFILTAASMSVFVSAAEIPDEGFVVKTETATEEFIAGETFTIKFSITDVAEGYKYAGIDLFISFDPEYFEAVTQKDDNENEIDALLNLPPEWTGDDNTVEIEFLKDSEGKQTGKIRIHAANDGSDDKDFKSNDFYAVVAFKCLKDSIESVEIKIDEAYCAYRIGEEYHDVAGKLSGITINKIIAPVKDNKLLIIIGVAAAAVIIIAFVTIFAVKKKK